MITKALTRSMVVATLAFGLVGVSTAASAAPSSGSNRTAAGQQQPIACSLVQAVARPLLSSGLPIGTVVNTVFSTLGGVVPVGDIRTCLGV